MKYPRPDQVDLLVDPFVDMLLTCCGHLGIGIQHSIHLSNNLDTRSCCPNSGIETLIDIIPVLLVNMKSIILFLGLLALSFANIIFHHPALRCNLTSPKIYHGCFRGQDCHEDGE